jgi:hypothetical protein
MNTNVHIEGLVLDGLSVASGQGDLVQAAVETELTRLLTEHGLGLSSAGDVPHLSAEPIQLTHGSKPSSLGHQIARTIYRSLTPATASPRETRFSGGRNG